MGRDIRIEEVANGYQLRAYRPGGGEIYIEPSEAVATTEEQVIGLFVNWVKGDNSLTETEKK